MSSSLRHPWIGFTAALALLLLVGCTPADDAGEQTPTPGADSAAEPAAHAPSDPSAMQDPAGAAAAADAIRSYYEAIDARDFAAAYALWADSGRASGQTFDEFRAGYEQTTSVAAQVGTPGRIEGAAGSRYIEIPATIRAVAGIPQCFRGTYTLRRAVVPGATAAQRAWHISDAEILELHPNVCVVEMAESVEDSVTSVLIAFADRLAEVSVLAPPEALRPQLREQYGSLVTDALLARWLEQPSEAPGRETSSPWPASARIESVEPGDGSAFDATGLVCYQTSASLASGACAPRRAFRARVARVEDGFRIADFAWQGYRPVPH
jgi:hypothetical protein